VSFLGWTFLFGAVAVAGPIVAHLLAKPRFRRVPFTMLQFLRTGQHESHSYRKLRDLLVLLLRCTIIVLLAILFARPVLRVKAEPQKHRSIHYLALDDSISMMYRDGRTTLFERMVEAALDRIDRAPNDAMFGLHGLASGRLLHGLTRNQAIAEVKRMTVAPKSAHPGDFLSTLMQAGQAASPGDSLVAIVLSDFTPNVLREFEQTHKPAVVDELVYEPVVPQKPVNNVAVADARAISATTDELEVDVAVVNYGDTEQQRDVVMKAADLKPASENVTLAPYERRVVRLRLGLGLGAHRADHVCLPIELTVQQEDALKEDDTYRLAAYIPRAASRNIVVVHRADETFLFETAIEVLADRSPTGLHLRRVREGRLTPADLDGTDIVVFPSPPGDFSCPIGPLKEHLAKGGRIVFFATEVGNLKASEYLLREGLLPAAPEKWVDGVVYPEAQPVAAGLPDLYDQAVRSLVNYQLDRIAMKGHWLCRAPSDAECIWRLADGEGFVYRRSSNGGSSILVNTSIDDSLGLLAKSRAWVAFCRSLIGGDDQVRQGCFSTEQRPVVTLPDSTWLARQGAIAVEDCDGRRARAVAEGARVLMPSPRTVGWMKTVDEPTLYAAINLPPGETDVRTPSDDKVAAAMKRAFVTNAPKEQAAAQVTSGVRDKPIWKWFAWAAILLLLIEPAIVNRLKR